MVLLYTILNDTSLPVLFLYYNECYITMSGWWANCGYVERSFCGPVVAMYVNSYINPAISLCLRV